jgi:hypothetical protein
MLLAGGALEDVIAPPPGELFDAEVGEGYTEIGPCTSP